MVSVTGSDIRFPTMTVPLLLQQRQCLLWRPLDWQTGFLWGIWKYTACTEYIPLILPHFFPVYGFPCCRLSYEEMREKFPETRIPNTPHDSHEESTGSASIHTPATIKARIKYFKNFITESNRSEIRTFPEITRLERKKISSCSIPKEQRYPQKKRPHSAVIRNTMKTRMRC